MLILVQDGQICGTAKDLSGVPSNMQAIEYSGEHSIESLYVNDGQLQLKPARPSETSVWQGSQWREPTPFVVPTFGPDWQGLFQALHHTPMWERAYEASGRTLKANRAFTLLLNTLTVSRSLDVLVFAIADLRDAMAGISAIGDFSAEELGQIDQMLATHGFDLRVGDGV